MSLNILINFIFRVYQDLSDYFIWCHISSDKWRHKTHFPCNSCSSENQMWCYLLVVIFSKSKWNSLILLNMTIWETFVYFLVTKGTFHCRHLCNVLTELSLKKEKCYVNRRFRIFKSFVNFLRIIWPKSFFSWALLIVLECLPESGRINSFIISILKSLVIPAIWLASSNEINSQITLLFALNHICSRSRRSCSKPHHFCFKSQHFCSLSNHFCFKYKMRYKSLFFRFSTSGLLDQ